MKKLLLALAACATLVPALANAETITTTNVGNQSIASTHNTFDSNNIVCGGQRIGANDNVNDLRGRCKDFKVQHSNVTFYDENSRKVVHCKSDKSGNVAVTECKAANI